MTRMEPSAPRTPQPGAETRRRSARRLGWGLVLAGLLVLGTWSAVTTVGLARHARSLRAHLQALQLVADAGASQAQPVVVLRSVGEHLAGVHADLLAVVAQAGPLLPAGKLLAWVPVHGGDLAAAAELLPIAAGVAAAGDRSFRALAPALDLMDGPERDAEGGAGLIERFLPLLAAAQPELQAAQRELAQAERVRQGLNANRLSPQVSRLLAQLDRTLPWFDTGVSALLLAPTLLGSEGPRTYLILIQNNHELRATGGFLSGVGELHINEGRMAPLGFLDSYAVDNLNVPHDVAPPDLQAVLSGELWFFRDTNWDADFPASARRAMQVYADDRGVQVDGVIALDLYAVQGLIGAVGAVKVTGLAEPLTSATVLEVIQTAWGDSSGGGADLAWHRHRKDFMGPIAGAVMDRLLSGEELDFLKVARATKQALDEKHLLIYLEEPQAATIVRNRNWDGALPATSFGDRLLVVDSNVGFNKVDASIEREIDYRVDMEAPDGPQARLTLTYRNRSTQSVTQCHREPAYGAKYADLMEGCYWDYIRVYVPAGCRLLAGPVYTPSFSGEPPPVLSPAVGAGDWEVWTAFVELAPGAEQILTLEYSLPDTVLRREASGRAQYVLRIQKQPGTAGVPLRVAVQKPAWSEVVLELPAELTSAEGVTTDLRVDRQFEVTFQERNP
jgi:hypothetical protein